MIKKDCFAYDKIKRIPECRALKDLYCAKGKCAFYKTEEQHNKDRKKYEQCLRGR